MDYWHFYFICPYFKWDDEKKVGCEGRHVMAFASREEAKKFMTVCCAGWEWEKCPHAQEMNEYYEREHRKK